MKLKALTLWLLASSASVQAQAPEQSRLEAVVQALQNHHPDAPRVRHSWRELLGGAMRDLDPHAELLSPNALKADLAGDRRAAAHTGVQLGLKEGWPMMLQPVKGMSADNAGIEGGELLVAVDGRPAAGRTLPELRKMMAGALDTEVELILLNNDNQTRVVRLTRGPWVAAPASLKWASKGVVHIQVNWLHQGMAEDIRQRLSPYPVEALVLDLRRVVGGNPETAIELASLFLPEGTALGEGRGQRKRSNKVWHTSGFSKAQVLKQPLAVLVSEHTSGAGEILAMGLRSWRRATLLGQTTFGDGRLQQVVGMQAGGGLRLTTGYWHGPKGEVLQDKGVNPQHFTPKHKTMARALELLKMQVPKNKSKETAAAAVLP